MVNISYFWHGLSHFHSEYGLNGWQSMSNSVSRLPTCLPHTDKSLRNLPLQLSHMFEQQSHSFLHPQFCCQFPLHWQDTNLIKASGAGCSRVSTGSRPILVFFHHHPSASFKVPSLYLVIYAIFTWVELESLNNLTTSETSGFFTGVFRKITFSCINRTVQPPANPPFLKRVSCNCKTNC